MLSSAVLGCVLANGASRQPPLHGSCKIKKDYGDNATFHDNLHKIKVCMPNLLSMCPGWKAKVRLVRVYEVPPSQVRHAGVDVMRRLKEQMFRAASREMRDVPATPPRKNTNKQGVPATSPLYFSLNSTDMSAFMDRNRRCYSFGGSTA